MTSKLPPSLTEHTPWENIADPIWPTSSFILKRNINGYRFAHKLDEMERGQLADMMKTALEKSPSLQTPHFFSSKELDSNDRQMIYEHFLTSHPSEGEGFLIDDAAAALCLINSDDHIALQINDSLGQWHEASKRLFDLERDLSEALQFAYHPKFGYLTTHPHECGTAFTAIAFLHLPALIRGDKLKTLLKESADLIAKGLEESDTDFVGDMVLLQNRYHIGVSEEEILKNLFAAANKIVAAERSAREAIKDDPDAHIKDLISRAYGLLSHSYELHAKETLDALSLYKLALDLGWLEGINQEELSQLYFKVRRAHLLHTKGERISQEELPHTRSEFLNEQLKNVTLKV